MIEVFFFNDTATTEIYTLSLPTLFRSLSFGNVEDIPLDRSWRERVRAARPDVIYALLNIQAVPLIREVLEADLGIPLRSEEHTSELQSRQYLVCRLLLEKKKQQVAIGK